MVLHVCRGFVYDDSDPAFALIPRQENVFLYDVSIRDVVAWILKYNFRWHENGREWVEWFDRSRIWQSVLFRDSRDGNKTAKSNSSSGGGGGGDKATMVIEDAERLKGWLTAILQPLCDADPAALAKYVLALIKKDKPEKELRQSMSDQLDVFLQNETQTFIDRLFELLRTKEYLTKIPPPIIPKEEPAMPTFDVGSSSESISGYSGSTTGSSSNFSLSGRSKESDKGSSSNTGDNNDSESTVSTSSEKEKEKGTETANPVSSGGSTKKDVRKEDDRDRGRRRRSRSPIRRRGARSRSRNRDKKYHQRKNWRSARRSRSRSPFRSSSAGRNRSRSPPRYRGRHGGSRSRSRSPKNIAPPRSPGNMRDKMDTKDNISRSVLNIDDRIPEVGLKDVEKPALQSVVVKAGATVEKIESNDYTFIGGNRCRDFDEKGLCMRGELCPFDHGNDPVVLEDVVIPGVNSASGRYNQADSFVGANMLRPGMGEYYPDNPGMDHTAWGLQFRPRMGFDPMMRGRPMMPRPMGPFPPPAAHRDLISIPVMGQSPMDTNPHPMSGLHPRMHMGRGRGRGGFDHSRLGFKPVRNYANCSLEVKKVPREHNNIMDLNSHFQKFGKIVNIQIQFESDPEAALVTFSAPAEAQAAYRSTEAVLNNRFIRVFWHSKEKENEDATEEPVRVPAKDRLGGIEGEMNDLQEKILVSGNNITKTVYNHSLLAKKTDAAAEKIQAVEAIKKNQEMLAAQETLKKKQEEKKKEAIRIIGDLRKRKQDMLDEQIKSQKKLISKLENKKITMKPEEVAECMSLIKAIQVQIERIKKDLEETAPKSQDIPKSKEEAEREMLDAELELYNKEQEGGDTLALQRKISDLRATARQLGVHFRGRGGFRGAGGRGGFTGRGRGGRQTLRALRTVDRRPTRIKITKFPVARLPEILPHFSQFGTITEYESDTVTPSMVLNFDSRKSAESAVTNGKIFGESELDITWVVGGAVEGGGDAQIDTSNGDGPHPPSAENGASMEEDEAGLI
ncbi:RNA-binding protein 26 [Folsomia candida]|uniref:RNA-binding protein 26 n=1 Tax=Folsomia candida TaxID=158441 RepID=A0A226E8R1_FOLCA|nr:RNA-binding protein 26 [Folsomia candida]